MDDEQIMDLFWQRSEQAISEMKAKYQALLFRLAQNIVSLPENAEECINDAYLKLWNTIPPERPMSLKNYAARIVRNLAIDLYRKSASPKTEIVGICEELEDILKDGKNDYEAAELKELINSFLATLDRDARILFVRRYWMSQTIEELSKNTGLKQSTVKMRLLRIREKFRDYLKIGGITV